MSPTLSDIANEVGVSVMTVSRALADRPGVAVETKQRVLEAARRLGYAVNQGTRSTSRNGTATIGVLVNNIGTEYIQEIIDGISNILDVASYDIVIYNPYRMRRQPDDYVFEVAQKPIDGLIIAAANILQSVDYLDQLCQQRFPIVFVDQRVEGTSIFRRNTLPDPTRPPANWHDRRTNVRITFQRAIVRLSRCTGAIRNCV